MENHFSDEGEEDQNDYATCCSPTNSSGWEQDDHSSLGMSELEMEFDKLSNKLPLILDFKQENDSQACPGKLRLCGNELAIPDCVSIIGPNRNFPGQCVGCRSKVSDSLGIFYGTASLFNIPLSLKSSALSLEIKGKQGRSRSITNVSDFILESSLLFQLGASHGKRRQPKLASVGPKVTDTKLIKSSELSRRSSEMDVSEGKLASCSSTHSRCSNSFSNGLLSYVWKNGVPYFVFSFNNDCGNIFVANPQTVESSTDKSLDYVYLFRSRNYKSRHDNSSGVVGKMKVSSSLVLNSNRSKFMETEFVLFGCREDYLKEMKTPSVAATRSKCLSKKVAEIFRSSHIFRHKTIGKLCEIDSHFDDQRFKESDDFSPNLELSAIVVKDHRWTCNKEASTGGWGLKFLEKSQVSDSCDLGEPLLSHKRCDTEINVIVPEGFHGRPNNGEFGPSSLIERWKSDGCCDCGGWDVGCCLRVLNNNSTCSSNLIKEDMEEECLPVCLFLEGTNHGEPTLRMVNKSEGLYLVTFHSSLSALQSFFIAVAIIHSRTLALFPKF